MNEDAVISILTDEGFDIINPADLTVKQQAEIANSSRIIVSAHGAALANMVFAQVGNCSIIEIFSPDYFRTDCYYTLAGILNLNYWYITGIKPQNADWGDISVPEDILKETLARVIPAQPQND